MFIDPDHLETATFLVENGEPISMERLTEASLVKKREERLRKIREEKAASQLKP